MSDVKIVLPDNSIREFDHQPTVLEVAESIGPRLAKDTLGGVVAGEIIDLRTHLSDGTKLEIITFSHKFAPDVYRHSAAHIMAQAVQSLFKGVQVTIGPVIDDGFYYDFYSETPFTEEDLEKIEKRMAEIVKENLEIVRTELPKKEAIELFKSIGEHFKVEII